MYQLYFLIVGDPKSLIDAHVSFLLTKVPAQAHIGFDLMARLNMVKHKNTDLMNLLIQGRPVWLADGEVQIGVNFEGSLT